MTEKFRFQSEEEVREISTVERLKESGGITYEETKDPESDEIKKFLETKI